MFTMAKLNIWNMTGMAVNVCDVVKSMTGVAVHAKDVVMLEIIPGVAYQVIMMIIIVKRYLPVVAGDAVKH